MPVTLGAKPESNFSDPFGLLSDCHRRIESFLTVLVKAGEIGDLDEGALNSLGRALNYFRDAAPKHTADEEESVFPRLRDTKDAALVQALALMESLERDHAEASLHAEVDALGRRWLERRSLEPEELRRFRELVGSMAQIYVAHIEAEDQHLFPIARRALEANAVEIGREMAARRGHGS
jgi:hemerythrin-like domain-containing protein